MRGAWSGVVVVALLFQARCARARNCCPNGTRVQGSKCEGGENINISCHDGITSVSNKDEGSQTYDILEDGRIRMLARGEVIEEFCFDGGDYNNLIFCFYDDQSILNLYNAALIISAPFLLATFSVYALISELRNLHGLIVMSHVFSLFVTYCLLIVVHLATHSMDQRLCTAVGFSVQFFWLAAFFWLSVMCYDIFCTFSGVSTFIKTELSSRRKFTLYTVFAWGGAFVVLAFTIILECVLPVDSIYKPSVGLFTCNLSYWGIRLYMYCPAGLLMFANTVMFAAIIVKVNNLSSVLSTLNSKDSRTHNNKAKKRFYIYLRLFLVMGITWVTEIISSMVDSDNPIWILTDLVNLFQAALIFVIFVCKRRVFRLLRGKFMKNIQNSRPNLSNASLKQ